MDSDIALVQLSTPLQFNHYLRPACLPANDEVVEPTRVCVITGWGIHNEGTHFLLNRNVTSQPKFIAIPSKGVVEKKVQEPF